MPKRIVGYCDDCQIDTNFNYTNSEQIDEGFIHHKVFYLCENGCETFWVITALTHGEVEIV
jgi:hypothetical protein